MCRFIRLFIVFIYVLGSHVLSAQTYNEYKQQKKEELSTFKSQREKEFSDYRSELNAQFADYLRQTWSQYCAHSSPDKPQKEPHVPPVVLPYLDDIRSYINRANAMSVTRNICIGGLCALYIYNIIDAFVAPGAKRVEVVPNGVAYRF